MMRRCEAIYLSVQVKRGELLSDALLRLGCSQIMAQPCRVSFVKDGKTIAGDNTDPRSATERSDRDYIVDIGPIPSRWLDDAPES